MATVITLIVTVVAVKAVKFFVTKKLNRVYEKICNSAESCKYDYQEIVNAYKHGGLYEYLGEGKFVEITKWQYKICQAAHEDKILTDAEWDNVEKLYDGEIESFTLGPHQDVTAQVTKHVYDVATKLYNKSNTMNKLKSKALTACGATAITYNVYDSLESDSPSVGDAQASSEGVDVDLDPVIRLIDGNV